MTAEAGERGHGGRSSEPSEVEFGANNRGGCEKAKLKRGDVLLALRLSVTKPASSVHHTFTASSFEAKSSNMRCALMIVLAAAVRAQVASNAAPSPSNSIGCHLRKSPAQVLHDGS